MRTFTQKVAFALVALLCFAAMPQAVMADDCLEIGEGTDHSSWYLPVANYYHNSYSQQLFLAEELEQGASQITSIAFQYDYTSAMTRTISVFMANTDATDLSAAFVTDGLEEVLSATEVTFDNSADWFTIELETPFAYDGTSNLVVAVYMNYSSAETGYSGGYRFAQEAMTGMSRYVSNDTSSPDQITLVNGAPTASGSVQGYRCNTQFCYTTSGGGPTCDKPDAVEANDVTANSATINWNGSASSYNLQYKASSDAEYTLVKNLSGSSYQLSGLQSNTAYQVQVQSICGENTSGWKSASFTTLIGLPYAEHFNASSAPSGWQVQAGQLQADGSVTFTTTGGWSFGTNNGVFDSHARTNIYGSSWYKWLITPAIPIPALEEGDPGYQMSFLLALTKYTGTLVEVDKTQQADDRFIVLASLDNGANWSVLREWNNAGSEYVYNDIACSAEGEEAVIDLSAYAGQTVLIAFYGESTAAGGDNNLHVDDVLIDRIPTCLKPTDLHVLDAQATSSTLPIAWTANSDEAEWLVQYKPTADAEAEWTTLDVTVNPYTLTGLAAFAEYEIRVAAVCSAEDITEYGKSIKAKTAAVVPFAQAFNTTEMPGEWKRYEALLEEVENIGAPLVATANGWKTGTQNGVFGGNHLYLNMADTMHYWLVSPVIEMAAGYQLSFDIALTTKAGSVPTAVAAGEQNDDKFIVFISTDGGAEWTTLGVWDNQGGGVSLDQISTEGQTAKFDLSAYASNSIMLALYGESSAAGGNNNLHISDLKIDLIPSCERPLSVTLGNIQGTTAELTWDADEEGEWEYGYALNPGADFAPVDADYTVTTEERIADLSGLAETTDYIFFVRRICSETEKSEPLLKTFKTIQTPASLPYEGDFEDGNGWLSIHGDFANEWVRGTAVANGGTHALYVSNDNGLSAAYSHGACVIYATKTFYFGEAGMYSISFDWMCNGESTYDYIRVALVPTYVEPEASTTVPSGLSTTALPEGWTALDGGSKLNQQTTWQTQRNEINIENVGYYKVVLVWKNDGSGGSAPAGAIDNFKISKLACRMPGGLAVGNITANSAELSWNDDEDGMAWEYAYALAGQEPDEYEAIDQNSLLLSGLEESSAYDFYLRKDCGDVQSESVKISFQTSQLPAEVGNLFTDDFESGNRWLFINGELENAWVYGTAAHNGEGTHALYISNDGGTTNAYTLNKAAVVFATKMFHFEAGAYTFQYDWLANGEGTSTLYDYLRVALVPADIELTAGTSLPSGVTATALPSGCIALDGGKGLNLQTEWQTFTTDEINIAEGNYMVVLLWRDDTSTGNQTPAAVDNFSISRIVCATPSDFAASDSTATTTSILLNWVPMSDEANWVIRYREEGAEEWEAVVPAASHPFLLEGLSPSTVYEAQVAAQCDPEDESSIGTYSKSISFATECDAVAAVSEDFEGSLLCWSAIQDGNGYPAILSGYPEDAYSGSKFLYFASQIGYEPADEYIILPELISLDGMRIKFYARNDYEDAEENATLIVGIMTDKAADSTFVALDTIVLTSATYTQFIVPFTAYVGAGKFVAIKMLAATQSIASALVEDVVVEAIPSCLEPASMAAVALTDHSATLAWTPQGAETNWLVRYRKAGAAEWGEPVLTTIDTLLIDGLEMGAAYEAQVAAWCDPQNDEAVSPYSGVISFTTLCGNVTILPWHVDFEDMAASAVPACWDNSASTSSSLAGYPERIWGVYEYNGNKMIRMYNYYVQSGDALINTPAIALPASPAYELSFDYAHTASCGDMTIKISVDGGDFVALAPAYGKTSTGTSYSDPGEFTTIDINLGAYAGHTVMIQFYSAANYGSGAIFVDNVDIHLAPSCIKPGNLTLADATANSLQIDWEPQGTESNWFVQYKKSADSIWTLVAEDVTAHPFTINGLQAASVYDIRVAAWCNPADSADASDYSNAISAATECEAMTVFPYAENFDSYEVASAYTPSERVMPLCWRAINTSSYSTYQNYPTVYYYSSTDYSNSTPNSLRFYSYYSSYTDYDPQDQYAILPEMEGINTLRMKFNARAYSASYDADFYVGVMSDPNDTATFEALAYIELESASYEAFEIRLNGYQGTGKYIAIKMLASEYSYRGFYMDDIVVEKLPSCLEPEDVVVSNLTASSATIGWTDGAEGQTAWQIAYSCDPEFDLAEAALIDVASNPYELTGLEADTLYTVYVRANCGETDGTSLWASATFRTAKSCQTPDELAADSISHNSALISWYGYGQASFNLRYSNDGENWIVANGVTSPYEISDLAPATTYRVQVQAACEDEDAWAGSFMFKTAYAAPFLEPFATTSIPNDWAQAQGLMSDILEGGAFASGSAWIFGTSNNFPDNHARINIYGTSRKNWLITPAIYNGGDNQLTFDLALTVYSSSSSAAPTAGGQTDDKFAVLISTDEGESWSVLREWNNDGSEYVYDAISNAGEEVTIDLTAYAGQTIMLGFYGESTVSNGDNNLHIDNVRIDAVPACAKPQALAVSDVFAHNATLAWTSNADAWQIALDTIAGFNPDTLSDLIDASENPFILSDLLPAHTYYVYVRAACGEDGFSEWTARKSFTTTVACPAPEGLEAELTPGNGSIATLTWEAGMAQAWLVEYSLNSDMSDSLVMSVAEPVANLTGLTAEATYYARVKADCGDLDGESAYSAIISFLPTDIFSIVVNDGTQTGNYVPVYGMYVDNGTTASQFIVPASELEDILWDSITGLTFYASQETSTWGASEFEVYMAMTESATLDALEDWESLTQVMVSGNLFIENHKMVVTLSEPFQYTGDNLLIGIKQTVASGSSADYSTASWYGQTVSGASIGGYGTGNNMTQRNFLPKMTVSYVPGEAPACMWATHLNVSEITAASATFTWDMIEDALWEYALVEGEDLPSAFESMTGNTVTIDDLAEATAYTFYLIHNCAEEGNSKLVSIAFSTIEDIEALPYETQFADADGWKFANEENAWMIADGQLFISNDGENYAYDDEAESVSFASKLFDFTESIYSVSYEWKCIGESNDEDGAIDYLRVALVPASVELIAGVTPAGLTAENLPDGWIALDSAAALVGQDEWQQKTAVVELVPGSYRIAFIWINDDSYSDGEPAAIASLSIVPGNILTGIESGAGIENKAVKFIRDNRVYIRINGVVYDMTGRKVSVQ